MTRGDTGRTPALALALGLYASLLENGAPTDTFIPNNLWRKATILFAETQSGTSIRNYTRTLEDLGLVQRKRINNRHGGVVLLPWDPSDPIPYLEHLDSPPGQTALAEEPADLEEAPELMEPAQSSA